MARRGFIWKRGENGQWYMTERGRQIPLGHDRDAAEREFYRRKAEGERQRESGLTLEAMADHFQEFLEREREPQTAETCRYFLKSFLDHKGKATPAVQVKPADVTAWLGARPTWGATTRWQGATIIKRFFNWSKREGLIPTNPIKEVEKPRPRTREDFITVEDADKLLDAARSPVAWDLLMALRETGCRPIEIYTLTADRVDLALGTWRVLNKTRHSTGQTYRTIYLSPAMTEISRRLIAEHPDGHVFLSSRGKPWTRRSIVKLLVRLRGRTGLGKEAIPYAFRHLYITDALEKGIPPATVAELVGHTNLNIIMKIYNKLKHRTDHLREAARMIRPAPSEPPSTTGI